MSKILLLLAVIECTSCGVVVYRHAHYATKTTANVTYTKTLVHCTDQTDQPTCTEIDMVPDVWQPANSTAAPFPIVMTVHGGAFFSGNQEDKDPMRTSPRGLALSIIRHSPRPATLLLSFRISHSKCGWQASAEATLPPPPPPCRCSTLCSAPPFTWALASAPPGPQDHVT
jgi:hypothetical protein